jgi:hypothetical protein
MQSKRVKDECVSNLKLEATWKFGVRLILFVPVSVSYLNFFLITFGSGFFLKFLKLKNLEFRFFQKPSKNLCFHDLTSKNWQFYRRLSDQCLQFFENLCYISKSVLRFVLRTTVIYQKLIFWEPWITLNNQLENCWLFGALSNNHPKLVCTLYTPCTWRSATSKHYTNSTWLLYT